MTATLSLMKLQWLSRQARTQFISDWLAPSYRLYRAYMRRECSNLALHRLVIMAPEEVRADFIAGWLETGTMPYVLTLWPACEPII